MSLTIREFQQVIESQYGDRDRERGTAATFLWFMEEVGELATALAGSDKANKEEEFGDVFAWLCTLANVNEVNLEKAVQRHINRNDGFK